MINGTVHTHIHRIKDWKRKDLSGEQTSPKPMNKDCLVSLWAIRKHRSCSNNLSNNDNL